MFGYMLKNLPAKYVFAGYSVRKSLTILTSEVNGHIVYDVFLYTYVDNYLSFYVQMDNGKYKNVENNVEVEEATAEDMMSKHLSRGYMKNLDDEQYDKEKIVLVFGLRNMETLMKQVDAMKKADADSFDVSLEALMDVKSQYMGMEIMGAINTFNKCLKYEKGRITVPPITYGPNDSYQSLIGDEMDYFDFMSGKDSDVIIQELKRLDDSLDGVGNVKKESIVNQVREENIQSIEESTYNDDIIDTLDK